MNLFYIILQSKILPTQMLPFLLQLLLLYYSTMSILYWNISGLCSHRNDLRYLLSIYEPHVICLHKTFLVQPLTPVLNYHFIHSPHSIAASSILSIIRHYILSSTLTLLFLVLCYESSFNVGLPLFMTFSTDPLYDLYPTFYFSVLVTLLHEPQLFLT